MRKAQAAREKAHAAAPRRARHVEQEEGPERHDAGQAMTPVMRFSLVTI
jgi:hypothetical protein